MEAKRRINITFEIPDNDQIQLNFENLLKTVVGADKITDFRALANTDHLKDEKKFKYLKKIQKDTKNEYYDYINENQQK